LGLTFFKLLNFAFEVVSATEAIKGGPGSPLVHEPGFLPRVRVEQILRFLFLPLNFRFATVSKF
jgi:hypothetical protein